MGLTDHIISGASTIATLVKEVSEVIPHASPLAPILGVTKELVAIINQMRDNQDGCVDLAERILRFLKGLSEESQRLNEPMHDGTPTALRLSELRR